MEKEAVMNIWVGSQRIIKMSVMNFLIDLINSVKCEERI